MKYFVVGIFVCLFLFTSGCKKDESNPVEDEFSNNLIIGTGVDYSKFAISGEGTSFTKIGPSLTLYWRLESKNDMQGSAVKIKIEKQNAGVYAAYTEFSYNAAQDYGHIMISSFSLTESGSYKATGILVNGTVNVASKEFTIN